MMHNMRMQHVQMAQQSTLQITQTKDAPNGLRSSMTTLHMIKNEQHVEKLEGNRGSHSTAAEVLTTSCSPRYLTWRTYSRSNRWCSRTKSVTSRTTGRSSRTVKYSVEQTQAAPVCTRSTCQSHTSRWEPCMRPASGACWTSKTPLVPFLPNNAYCLCTWTL